VESLKLDGGIAALFSKGLYGVDVIGGRKLVRDDSSDVSRFAVSHDGAVATWAIVRRDAGGVFA